MIIQSLWIGNNLSRMEVSSIKSFLSLGYNYHLYSYSHINNVPKGVKILDGNQIIDKSEIFTYNLPDHLGGNSFSAFSNFFRYKLLYEKGGWWVDTDVYALRHLPLNEYVLAKENENKISSCILKFPPKHKFSKICFEKCKEKNKDNLKWGETGPLLVTEVAKQMKLETFKVQEFFPINYDEIEMFFKPINIPSSYTIHFWNEMWRRKKIYKNKVYDKKTLYEKLISNFEIKLL